jgi:hypothetical protein
VKAGREDVGVAEYWTIDGGALTIEGEGVEGWPPARAAVAARTPDGLAVLESGGHTTLRMLLEQFDGMHEAESYEHEDGPVVLMQGSLYGHEDFAYEGEQYALLWEHDGVGLVARASGRRRGWFTDFAATVRTESNGRSIRARPATPTDWGFEALPTPGLRLLVTIPGVGVARLPDDAGVRRRSLRSDRTRSLPAGTLHAFHGERQGHVVLEAPTAQLDITLLETTAEDAAERLAALGEVRWLG